MGRAWFKMHTKTFANPALRAAMRDGSRHGNANVAWVYMALMAFAAQTGDGESGELRGTSDAAVNLETVADFCGLSRTLCKRAAENLAAHGLLVCNADGSLFLPGFSELQVNRGARKMRSHRAGRSEAGNKLPTRYGEAEAEAEAEADPPLTPLGGEGVSAPAPKAKAKRTRKPKPLDPPVDLPAWVPPEAWAAFDEMRRTGPKRSAWTATAQRLTVDKLDGFRAQGHDVAAILGESVMNGWTGVFAPKANGGRRDVQGLPLPSVPTPASVWSGDE